jgi:hypothetical protein
MHSGAVLWLLVTANVVPITPTNVILMMEALRSSEAYVLTRVTRRNIPEDGVINTKIDAEFLTLPSQLCCYEFA